MFLSAIITIFIWFSFATIATLNSEHSVNWDNNDYTISDSHYAGYNNKSDTEDKRGITRTVIPVVPKTGPNGNLIWIIIATFVIFGGYIYIKKRADI